MVVELVDVDFVVLVLKDGVVELVLELFVVEVELLVVV